MALEIFLIHSRVCSGGLFFNKTISQAKFFLNSCLVSHSIPKSLLSKRGNEEGFALFCCEKWKKMRDEEVDLNRYVFLLTEDGRFVGERKIGAPNAINATNRIRRILGEVKLKKLKVQLIKVIDGTGTKTLWEFGDENDPK